MSVHLIRAYGTPVPQGSKRAFVGKSGKAVVVDDRKKPLREWRGIVAHEVGEYAEAHPGNFPLVAYPVRVSLMFFMPRPKLHYSAKGGIKDSFLAFPHITKPDLDKLTRAIFDACTGILWQDDSLITDVAASKRYADPAPPGVELVVTESWLRKA